MGDKRKAGAKKKKDAKAAALHTNAGGPSTPATPIWGQITALTHTHTHKIGIPRCISGKGGPQDLRVGVPMPAIGDTDDRKKSSEILAKNK